MDDEKIISLLWQRAESAIAALAQRFGGRLYATAMNLLSDRQDAEECVNDTYLALWNAIPPRRPEPLSPFVYRVGRNIALNRLRANTAMKRSGYDLSLEELSWCISTPCKEDAHALGRAIDAFLDTIHTLDRVIFLRRYWFGDSVKDIAQQLKTTENAVSMRLHRTRNKLRIYLTEEGYYE